MRSGVTRRAALLGATLFGLTAIVALASRARTPAGGGPARSVPTDLLLEYLLLIIGVAVVASVVAAVYLLGIVQRSGRTAVQRPESSWRTLVVFAAIGTAVVALISTLHSFGHNTQPIKRPAQPAAAAARTPGGKPVAFDWVPVAVVGGLTALGIAAAGALLLRSRVPKKRLPAAAAEAVAVALDESLDDLLAEPDPRRAVIAAYARMERALAGGGLARRRAEAPREYLARTLSELGAGSRSVERLTPLFERAKFSPHEIDTGMKEEAITALLTLRDELRGRG